MTDKEKIIAYIDKLLEKYPKNYYLLMVTEFIDSMQEEPVSKDLEEASQKQKDLIYPLPLEDDFDDPCFSLSSDNKSKRIGFDKGFKVGAQWKKKEMIANAIDAQCFGFQGAALFSFRLPADNYLIGSEVKVIVIKKD